MIDSFYAPHFDVRISGLTLASDITNQVLSVTYDNDLDMADMFSIVLRNADNQLLDSALFDLGKTVEIYMGYGNDLTPMILGEITALEPSFPEKGPPTLHISGYDKSYKLRHNQPDRKPFQYVTDSVIAAEIAGEVGLIPVVDPSPIFHQDPIIQASSDMTLLKERARANFFDVYVYWDKLYFQFPRPQTAAYTLQWGQNLSSYEPRISSAGLAGLQVIRSYNEELAESIVSFAMAADFNPDDIIEKMGSAALDLLLSLGRRVIRHEKIKSSSEALTVAKSIMQEILEGMYEGTGQCVGIPDLRARSYVSIQGVGKRFSGVYRLRKVVHTIDRHGYRTNFTVTQQSNTSFLPTLRKQLDLPSPHQQEPFYGVVVGKVTQNVDTSGSGLGRVKVSFPWLSDAIESGWMRCATPMAGDQVGMYFLPEVGDEVLVAFDHGDISNPIVLGGLWNAKRKPPTTNTDGSNNIKMIKTRSGHTITLDDTKGKEQIVIQDKGGSKIVMSHEGNIRIEAADTLTLKAKTVNVNVDNEMNVS